MTVALRQPMTVAGFLEREERRGTAAPRHGGEDRGHASTASGLRTVMPAQAGTGGTPFERAGDDRVGPVLTAASAIARPGTGIAMPLAGRYGGLGPADPPEDGIG